MELWQGILFAIYTFGISAMAYHKGLRDEQRRFLKAFEIEAMHDADSPASMAYMETDEERKSFQNN